MADLVTPEAPYLVTFLYEGPPSLDAEALGRALAERLGEVEVSLPGEDDEDDEDGDEPLADESDDSEEDEDDAETSNDGDRASGPTFALLDRRVELADAAIPAMLSCWISPVQHASLEPALAQTWDWSEARATVHTCTHALTFTDFMTSSLGPARLELIEALVECVLRAGGVRAVHVLPAQRVVNPEAFLAEPRGERVAAAFVNVRFFRVSDREEGEAVMDTMGLGILGLPDVQCHFARFPEPGRLAGFLYGVAEYLVARGDVIENGATVPGPGKDDRWPCQHEKSLVAPERVVLDVRPGEFAAGGRH